VVDKIWANSGDSHFLEPEDVLTRGMPKRLADRMPRTERDGDWEFVHVDGQTIRRRVPRPIAEGEFEGMSFMEVEMRPPGARDATMRLKDLDNEGIWGEVVYPSLTLWNNFIRDPELARAAAQAINDWAISEVQAVSPRLVCTANLPLRSVEDAVAELQRAASLGFKAVLLPTGLPEDADGWNNPSWEPLWAAADEAGLILTFHIGTDVGGADIAAGEGGFDVIAYRGAGGAVLNYVETTFSGQRVAMQLVAGGALDRHPNLKVLISEGGATWVPQLADRMEEAYRQHNAFVRPKLSRGPREILFSQVYASFQHDMSAVAAYTAMGYPNVMFGSDYPHIEGTFGHTQETLRDLFDGVDDAARRRVTCDAFLDLFPHVGEPAEALVAV
jgi:predicted TIM-barrel fold metal-dependent hydrolase